MAYKLIDKRYDPIQKAEKMGFLCDTDEDFADLPTCCPASVAITPAGTGRMVNASGEWVEYIRATGGGGNNDELESALDDVIALQNSYIGGMM